MKIFNRFPANYHCSYREFLDSSCHAIDVPSTEPTEKEIAFIELQAKEMNVDLRTEMINVSILFFLFVLSLKFLCINNHLLHVLKKNEVDKITYLPLKLPVSPGESTKFSFFTIII